MAASSHKSSHDVNYNQLEPISTFAMRYTGKLQLAELQKILEKIFQNEFYPKKILTNLIFEFGKFEINGFYYGKWLNI